MLSYLLEKAIAAATIIGNTELTTAARTLTGAINELNAKNRNDTVAGYGSAQSLGTAFSIVPMDGDYVLGASFTNVSDGGYRVRKNGLLLVSAYVYISGVNAGDSVVVNVGRYNSGWVWESASYIATGTTAMTCVISDLPVGVNANDIIYLRARNTTAARGTASSSRLVAEYV